MPTRHILSAEIDLEEFTKRVENVTSKGQKDALVNPGKSLILLYNCIYCNKKLDI